MGKKVFDCKGKKENNAGVIMDNLGGLLGTVLVAGVLLKTTDYLFRKQKMKDKKKLKAIW